MANTSIKDAAKTAPVTAEQVGQTIELVIEKPEVITQKIYVGPNILGLAKYSVIENEFTAHIKGFIEKCPSIEKLFVPILEMTETETRAKEKGTLEYRHYQNVVAFEAEKKGAK